MKILVINGPNLNLLGIREPHIYGSKTLDQINDGLRDYSLTMEIELTFFQSNHEGDIIDRLHQSDGYQGIILNPGALMSYSYSLKDAISSIKLPVVEVHISNIHAREAFRHHSVISDVVIGSICGLKEYGYYLAINAIKYLEVG